MSKLSAYEPGSVDAVTLALFRSVVLGTVGYVLAERMGHAWDTLQRVWTP